MTGGPAALALLGEEDLPVTIPREPARRAAQDELSQPIYHRDDPGPVEQAVDWLWQKLAELLRTFAEAAPGGAIGLTAVVFLAVLVIAALWARLGTPRRARHGREASLFEDRPRSAAEHRATAEAHAAAGRWSEALQERLRAVVRSLEERALLDPRPGRTADEAATEAGRALPGQAAALRTAAVDFDEVTYAGRPADESSYTRMRALDDTLRATTPQLEEPGSGR